MSQTIIELSEKSSASLSNNLTSNGDYEITLKERVVLKEGDRVDLKSVFIDSVQADEGKIVVDEDTTGYVEVIPYIYNWTTADKQYNGEVVNDATQLETQPDGKPYFASTKITQKDDNLRKYDSIAIGQYDNFPMVGNVVITIQYTQNNGTTNTFKINIPPNLDGQQIFILKEAPPGYDPAKGDNNIIISPESFVLFKNTGGTDDVRNSMKLISPSASELNNTYQISDGFINTGGNSRSRNGDVVEGFSNQTNPNASNFNGGTSDPSPEYDGGIIHPRKKQISFSVNKGEYYMSEICQTISDQITQNGQLTTRPMNNPLLTSDLQIKSEEGISDTNTTDIIYYTADDGSNVFRYANDITNDYFIGSDQFGLVADDATQKAKFVSLHSSLYDTHGNVVVKYIKDGTRANADLFQANKNGGVVISDLSPPDFWEKLGFGQADTPTQKSIFARITDNVTLTKGAINGLGVYKIDSTEGIYTTGQTKGIADAIVKVDGAGNLLFDKVQNVNGLNINTDTTTQIFAQTGLTQSIQRDGYYKIRVDLGINNELINSDLIQNNIQGIISKYFSSNSYTSDMGEGSIPYIHKGNDTIISRIRVRILNSAGVVDENIGDDNTIFLSITRNESNSN